MHARRMYKKAPLWTAMCRCRGITKIRAWYDSEPERVHSPQVSSTNMCRLQYVGASNRGGLGRRCWIFVVVIIVIIIIVYFFVTMRTGEAGESREGGRRESNSLLYTCRYTADEYRKRAWTLRMTRANAPTLEIDWDEAWRLQSILVRAY